MYETISNAIYQQAIPIALIGSACLLLFVALRALGWVRQVIGFSHKGPLVDFEADYANDRLRFEQKYGAISQSESIFPPIDFDGRASIYEAQEAYDDRRAAVESESLEKKGY